MILNVNRLLHTPGASQDFHFEMDLSDLEFGGEKPVVRPVVVDGRVYNQAGVLLCELQASTTLRCVCDRCMEEFDAPKSASFSCVLAQEKQDMENDDIVLLDHDEVDLADLAGTAFILIWTRKPSAPRTARAFARAAASTSTARRAAAKSRSIRGLQSWPSCSRRTTSEHITNTLLLRQLRPRRCQHGST